MSKSTDICSCIDCNEIEVCSCDEALHLRDALQQIMEESAVDGNQSLGRIHSLAFLALRLKPLDE